MVPCKPRLALCQPSRSGFDVVCSCLALRLRLRRHMLELKSVADGGLIVSPVTARHMPHGFAAWTSSWYLAFKRFHAASSPTNFKYALGPISTRSWIPQIGETMAVDQPDLIGSIAAALLAYSWLCVILRVYVRSWVVKAFGADDWFAVASLVRVLCLRA
jgi:hypothetical protein